MQSTFSINVDISTPFQVFILLAGYLLDVRTANIWLFFNLIIDTDMFVPRCANCNILPQFEQGTQINNSVSLKTELEHEKILKNQTTFLNRSLS